jgi:mono/diheme cytochrome c family protein
MKKIMLLIVTLIGIISWQACQYEWVEPAKTVVPEVVSYSADIQPIFNQACVGCHSTGGINPDLTPANSYADLFANNLIDTVNPDQSILYLKIAEGGSMAKYAPPGDPDEIILKWIKEGALNN